MKFIWRMFSLSSDLESQTNSYLMWNLIWQTLATIKSCGKTDSKGRVSQPLTQHLCFLFVWPMYFSQLQWNWDDQLFQQVYWMAIFESVPSTQIVTDVICNFTYLFGLNVTIDCGLVLGRILFQPLPCNLVSVVVLVWKSSILFMTGSTNWLRSVSLRDRMLADARDKFWPCQFI